MNILLINKEVKFWKLALTLVGSFAGLVVVWVALGYLGAGYELTVPAAWVYIVLCATLTIDHVRKSPLKLIETRLTSRANLEAWVRHAETSPYTVTGTKQIIDLYVRQSKEAAKNDLADKIAKEQSAASVQTVKLQTQGVPDARRAVV